MSLFNVHPDIAKAKTLHTSFYTNLSNFEVAKAKIFFPSWQFIGDTSLVPEIGSCYPFTLLPGYLDEPLLLTRPENGQVHIMSNVCTHRGNILVNEPCKSAHIRCRYHGRLFGLDGKFKSMPEFKEVENFPAQEDNLHGPSLYKWGNLLFINLEQKLNARNYLGDMMDRLSFLPLEEFHFRPDLSVSYEVKAHWALYCENYL